MLCPPENCLPARRVYLTGSEEAFGLPGTYPASLFIYDAGLPR